MRSPAAVHGVQQKPLEGVSMVYSFEDAHAAERHDTQYFELPVNRGIGHEGWTAVTRHSIPWAPSELPSYDDARWELYAQEDWTQAHLQRHAVTAEVVLPDGPADGVIVAQDGGFGGTRCGWSSPTTAAGCARAATSPGGRRNAQPRGAYGSRPDGRR